MSGVSRLISDKETASLLNRNDFLGVKEILGWIGPVVKECVIQTTNGAFDERTIAQARNLNQCLMFFPSHDAGGQPLSVGWKML